MSKTINDVIEEYCKKKLPPSEIFRLMKEVVSREGSRTLGLVLQESGVTLKEP